MGKIIQFPKDKRTAEFYRFLVKWSDGVMFRGDTIEECFRQQKDIFEPEYSMNEYLERFRARLEDVTGEYYAYTDIKGLAKVLVENGYLQVLTVDDKGNFYSKFG